ncbi:AcvB/VirJ family lysyl-phosphatidylglycerol hydrolase [Rubrimonas cliftonensis]|uniref:Type IV secretory pathway, VirJ component n=1 Tax=Rubrimonas cliftonensis TaxID=89524 RepID=A0A1H4DAW3_9RHOB|nr:AcvB/VirJ family lysyl-phosphatidylglycerol hydrolase [Rubrimonas cliftonensis]SEA69797.1 Type IV secretory pathway, VirJ component [Rubrimonas cliftonensis]
MTKIGVVLAVAALAGAALAANPPAAQGAASPAAVHRVADQRTRSIAVMVSGAEGWTAATDALARDLSRLHALVVGVDLPAWLAAEPGGCVDAASALLGAADAARAREGVDARIAPTLIGLGSEASAAAYAALAQGAAGGGAPFKGLVTVGFDGVAPRAFCGVTGADGRIAPPAKAPALWNEAPLLPGSGDESPLAATLAAIDGARLQPLTEKGRVEAFRQAYLRIAGADARADEATISTPAEFTDLALVVHRDAGAPQSDAMAVFLSGDGGWAAMDVEVAERLAAAGVPVAGVSTLRYLWREKRPERIAADVARILDHYAAVFGARRALLIGFSLGANVTPFYARHLPPRWRDRVAGLGLIAPEPRTGFEFHVGGWLGFAGDEADVGAAIDATPFRLACLHGAEETQSPCPGRPGARVFDGGHHLGKDYDGVAQALLALLAGPPAR